MLLALLPGIKVGSNFDLGHARTLNSYNIVLLFTGLKQLSTIFQNYYNNLLNFFYCYPKTLKFLMLDFSESPKFSMFQ